MSGLDWLGPSEGAGPSPEMMALDEQQGRGDLDADDFTAAAKRPSLVSPFPRDGPPLSPSDRADQCLKPARFQCPPANRPQTSHPNTVRTISEHWVRRGR